MTLSADDDREFRFVARVAGVDPLEGFEDLRKFALENILIILALWCCSVSPLDKSK